MQRLSLIHIETSTAVCSVALSAGEEVVFAKASYDGPSHAALLGVYVEEALAVLRREALTLSAVAVSSGPGSYTGLRIGVSLAKGLCFGSGLPLIAVPTLEILTAQAMGLMPAAVAAGSLWCPMLDARRMEVYAALYDCDRRLVRPPAADIVTADTYASFLLQAAKVYFFGDGAAKCKEVLMSASPQACFIDDVHPLATAMIPLAGEAFRAGRFVDTAYFVPFYLKEFMATQKKAGLPLHGPL
jgi:tRNA threonylcarbamoyladenosine biosynthesis protein TsaB